MFVGVVIEVYKHAQERTTNVHLLTEEQSLWSMVQRSAYRTKPIPLMDENHAEAGGK